MFFTFYTNSEGYLCKHQHKSREPESGNHTGKQERKRRQQAFAARCGGVYNSGGAWYRERNDGTLPEKIWVTGFPDEDFMEHVISYANKRGRDYLIPSEELDEVFRAAAAATSPEGRRLAEQERQRLEQERLEREAREKEAMRLKQEELLKERNAQYELRLKKEYAEEEAWWLENSSRLMDLLGF